jgi:hypothetical protein
MQLYKDIPSSKACAQANPELWTWFVRLHEQATGRAVLVPWSEAEVVQWLDLEGVDLHAMEN